MPTPIVPAEGSLDAPFVLIGESPGTSEAREGKPFCGASGKRLEDWWSSADLKRSQFYITNVVKQYYGPTTDSLVAVPDLRPWFEALHEELAQLKGPRVIVPVGNIALAALWYHRLFRPAPPKHLKPKKPARLRAITAPSAKRAASISLHRGSLLRFALLDSRIVKLIPTVHPAATFRTSYWEARCRLDWKRIAAEAKTDEWSVPERTHLIRPTLEDIGRFTSLWYQAVQASPDTAYLAADGWPRRAYSHLLYEIIYF